MNSQPPEQGTWIIRASVDHLDRLAHLRLQPFVEGARDGTEFWLRGSSLDEALRSRLAAVAAGPILRVEPPDWLIPEKGSVPIARLPQLTWQPLAALFSLSLPPARLPAYSVPRCRLTLQQNSTEQPASVLETDWELFRNWAEQAPEVRLRACRFAVTAADTTAATDGGQVGHRAATRRALIVGTPLPPLPGHRYWLSGRVAIPLGFEWSPAVDLQTLETCLQERAQGHAAVDSSADRTALLVWSADGPALEVIAQSMLLPVTRAAVRRTETRRGRMTLAADPGGDVPEDDP
jgi:MoxR-vWA-beta-propeller ternary system domain bpX2